MKHIQALIIIIFGIFFSLSGMAMMASGLWFVMAGFLFVGVLLVAMGCFLTFGTLVLVEQSL
jgi:hypothetical protein